MLHGRTVVFFTAFIMALTVLLSGCNEKAGSGQSTGAGKYPQKTINLLVPHSPGGATDILARAFHPFLQKAIGGTVIIVNLPGGGGNDANAQLFKAKPDGYTLGLAPFPSAVLGQLAKNGDFRVKEFTFLENVSAGDSNAVFVRSDSPYQTLKDLVEDSKNKKITMAGSGIATNSHLCLTLLERTAGTKFEYVSFESGKAALIGVAGGHTKAGISNIIDLKDLTDSGKIRVLASFGPTRHFTFPNVPTVEESGYKNATVRIATGLIGPPNMAPELAQKITAAAEKAVKDPEFKKITDGLGTSTTAMGPDEFKKMVVAMFEQADGAKEAMKPK